MAEDTGKAPAEQRHGIQVIARSAQILRVLGGNPQGLSLAAIAEQCQLPRSTVQRIVTALVDELLAEPCPEGSGFRLGPAFGQLLFQTQTDIIGVVRPLLLQLSDQFAESAFLAARAGNMINVIERVIAEHTLRVVFPVGHSAPVPVTAGGKALLAMLDDELLGQFLQSYSPQQANNLRTQIGYIRTTGIAIDIDEHETGICAYAVGLQTYLGHFTAGLVMPSARRPQSEAAITSALLNFKAKVEARIGFRPKY